MEKREIGIVELQHKVDSLERKCKHIEQIIKLMLKDLCLKVVETPSQIELKPTYEE